MRNFGADEWVANWDQPGSGSQVNVVDASGGTATVPYYLAADVPAADVPAHGEYIPSAGTPTYPGTQPIPADTSAGFDWGGLFRNVGGLVNIFGQVVRPQGTQMVRPPVQAPTPTWVWIVGGVAVVGVIGVVIASSGRKSAVAGYKRKRSRR
jgi:hypothetical protein